MKSSEKKDGILSLSENKTSNRALRESFRVLFDNLNAFSISMKVGLFILLVWIGYVIGLGDDTTDTVISIAEVVNTILLSIFCTTFTGYSLFQALLNKNMLRRMIALNENQKTYLEYCNEYFLRVMLLDVICIISNFFVIMLGKVIPIAMWNLLPHNIRLHGGSIIFAIYMFIEILTMVEVKCFVFNIYQLFNVFAFNEAIQIIDDDEKKNKIQENQEEA